MTLKKSFLGINLILLIIPFINSLYMFYEDTRRRDEFVFYTKSVKELLTKYNSSNPDDVKTKLPDNLNYILYNDNHIVTYSTDKSVTTDNYLRILKNKKYFSNLFKLDSGYIIIYSAITALPFKNNQKDNRFISMLTIPLIPAVISIVIVSIIAFLLLRSLRKSIFNLTNASKQISSGNLEYKIEDSSIEELKPLKDSLENLKIELLSSRDKRARFIMGISHDLKTPLSLINGYVEALSDEIYESEEEKYSYLSIIKDKSQELEDIISDLINLSRLDTGEWKTNLNVINLGIILDKIADKFKFDSKFLGVNFQYYRKCEIETACDIKLINRVLDNLFSNAVKAVDKEGVIKLIIYKELNRTVIELLDNGKGINKKDLGLIFEPFYKGSRSRTDNGHGLGLATVKTIIINHSWDITVESPSTLGSGTSFKIIL